MKLLDILSNYPIPKSLVQHIPNNSTKIAVCSGCKSNPDGRLSYRLASIPACIEHVPYTKKISLSRLSSYSAWQMQTRSSNIGAKWDTPKNRRSLTLYSSILGTFLQRTDLSEPGNCWYHPSLYYACEWLQNNNPYLVAYHSLASRLLEQSELSSVNLSAVWPQAMHIPEDNIAPLLIRQIY